VAVLGTVFFDTVARGHFHAGFRATLLVEIGLQAGLLVLSPLLPRFAREQAAPAAAEPALEPV
jgi:hypothetical protein